MGKPSLISHLEQEEEPKPMEQGAQPGTCPGKGLPQQVGGKSLGGPTTD